MYKSVIFLLRCVIIRRTLARFIIMEGKCDTVAGEILRASKALYNDMHTNGVGMKNTSGVINYLIKKNVVKMEEVEELYLCSRFLIRGTVEEVTEKMYPVVEMIVYKAQEFIREFPTVLTEKNTEDGWWDYMEDDIIICDVCECTSLTDNTIEERELYEPSMMCRECYMNLDFDDKYQ